MAEAGSSRPVARLAREIAKTPVRLYRWTLKPLLGHECRHLPTCSEYALDAIEINGAWRGWWLAGARVCRCHPWGTSGYDPAPDICHERHWLTPWQYGRWSKHQVESDRPPSGSAPTSS